MSDIFFILLPLWFWGFLLHGLVIFLTFMSQIDSLTIDAPCFTPNEGAVWAILWPLMDILAIARFLAPGVKSLWKRI